MLKAEQYLRHKVIAQVSRLDLKARFIVEGFLSGLHASPFQGFSVEFSEHRKYTPGDDIKDLDWNVYAKTGKYYVKKYRAETNMTGWLLVDLSASMDYAYRPDQLTKFDYGVCLAAALGYLMVMQQDPAGLVTFDTKLQQVLPAKSKRTQIGTMLSVLAQARPTGTTDAAAALTTLAPILRGKSLVMLFSDLLTDREPLLQALYRLRHAGHEIILFHILDEAEVHFPFTGLTEFEDVETEARIIGPGEGLREGYIAAIAEFRQRWRDDCGAAGVDFVPMDTSIGFDKALLEYLIQRQRRFT